MKEIMRLAEEIFNEALKDNEPIEWEDAVEMAKMEIKAREIKRYEKSETSRKKSSRERKIDEEKKYLLNLLLEAIQKETCISTVKNETEFSFDFGENSYSVKLIKHRPPKN